MQDCSTGSTCLLKKKRKRLGRCNEADDLYVIEKHIDMKCVLDNRLF